MNTSVSQSQADGYNEPESLSKGREIAVLIGDGMSMDNVRKNIEFDGYEIIDTLHTLRCFIVKVKQDQLKTIDTFGETWNKKIVKPQIDFFD
jgi:hypothetical protein